MKELILIVTAAGLGTRLKEYSLKKNGKYIDKPLIRLKNKTLLSWSIKPFYPLITNGLLKFSNIYVVGGFQNRGISQTGTFGPFQITSNGEWDAFIFKMDKDGNWQWAKGIGSNKTDRANGIAIDVCDDILSKNSSARCR